MSYLLSKSIAGFTGADAALVAHSPDLRCLGLRALNWIRGRGPGVRPHYQRGSAGVDANAVDGGILQFARFQARPRLEHGADHLVHGGLESPYVIWQVDQKKPAAQCLNTSIRLLSCRLPWASMFHRMRMCLDPASYNSMQLD